MVFTLLTTVSPDKSNYHVEHAAVNLDHTYKIRIADALGYPGAFAECGTVYAPSPGI